MVIEIPEIRNGFQKTANIVRVKLQKKWSWRSILMTSMTAFSYFASGCIKLIYFRQIVLSRHWRRYSNPCLRKLRFFPLHGPKICVFAMNPHHILTGQIKFVLDLASVFRFNKQNLFFNLC